MFTRCVDFLLVLEYMGVDARKCQYKRKFALFVVVRKLNQKSVSNKMGKTTLQKIKDILDLPGSLGIGLTLLEIAILGIIFYFNKQEKIQDPVTDPNEWIYGDWKCQTPNGIIVLTIEDGGRIYDGIDDNWYTYTINDNEIIEQLDGYVSIYHIDRAHKRFDCGQSGLWFHKVTSIDSKAYKKDNSSKESIRFVHESDVHFYLRTHNFTNQVDDITITESGNMTLKFNGQEMTGAIIIYSFDSHQAIFTAYCPINGVTYRFMVDNSKGALYCDNERKYYYAR